MTRFIAMAAAVCLLLPAAPALAEALQKDMAVTGKMKIGGEAFTGEVAGKESKITLISEKGTACTGTFTSESSRYMKEKRIGIMASVKSRGELSCADGRKGLLDMNVATLSSTLGEGTVTFNDKEILELKFAKKKK